MDTSREYIKMCDCPEIQGTIHEWRDRKSWSSLVEGRDEFTWLPRQDQIQAMFRNNCTATGIGSIQLIDWINAWIEERSGFNRIGEYSMEEIWLRFYMSKKHHKIWDGEKWVTNE